MAYIRTTASCSILVHAIYHVVYAQQEVMSSAQA